MPKKDLSQTEEQFRLLVESVREYAILLLDSTGRIVTWNSGAERLKGYKADEIIGQNFSRFYTPEAIETNHPAEELQIATTQGSHHEEGWRVRKDGSQFWADVLITAIYDENGNLYRFAKVTRNLDERKRAEEQLLKANSELIIARDLAQAASRLKSEFVANMSHEIRTPMNAIVGMCDVLLRTGLDPKQHQYACNIKDGANSLLAVINDILDFSKIEAGKLELDNVDFDPVKVVEGVCELLATAARGKHLSLVVYVDPNLPQRVNGDPERLRQVLVNLTSNAIKFSEQGEIVVRADVESNQANGANVRFSVLDSGIGLTDSEKDSLFRPFVQADGTISRRFGGTGLGLSISKRLVELMNGSIGVESHKGFGSTFHFTIPLERRSDNSVITLRDELKDVRVLVVDDEPYAREIMHRYILSWGMKNGVAVSAKEALKLLRQAYVDGEPYTMVIIDFVMPEKNGMDLAREIFADPAISATKLILLTAFDAAGVGLRAINFGFKAYLTKPVRQSQMLECIVDVLSGTQVIARSAVDARLAVRNSKRLRNELILVAEDYIINQQVVQLHLEELGFTAHIVDNGLQALEAAMSDDYAAILMDCQMPEMDGFAATAAIRQAEEHLGRHTPIIAVTAHAMSGDRDRCLVAGMDDYISKPIDPTLLQNVLEKWLPAAPNPDAQVPNEASKSPVDLQLAKSKYGKTADQLFRMFLETAPAELTGLRQAASAEDKKLLLDRVHGFKGVCTTIFALSMRTTCTDIEAAVRDQDWGLVDDLILRAEQEFQLVAEQLRSQHLMD